jgi:hypothetical protein
MTKDKLVEKLVLTLGEITLQIQYVFEHNSGIPLESMLSPLCESIVKAQIQHILEPKNLALIAKEYGWVKPHKDPQTTEEMFLADHRRE